MSFEDAKRLQAMADRLEKILAERADLKLSDSELETLDGLVQDLDVAVTSYEELQRREVE